MNRIYSFNFLIIIFIIYIFIVFTRNINFSHASESFYVVPYTEAVNSGSGTFDDPWNGFSNINWLSIPINSTLYVCGTHYNMLNIGLSDITVNGNCPESPGVIDRSIDIKSIDPSYWEEVDTNIWEYKDKLYENKAVTFLKINGKHGRYKGRKVTDINNPNNTIYVNDLQEDGDWFIARYNEDAHVKFGWPYNARLWLYAKENPATYPDFNSIITSEPASANSDANSHDPAETGVLIKNKNNVTITNLTIRHVGHGANWQFVNYGERGGIVVSESDNCKILRNSFIDNGFSIQTYGENNSTEISENNINGLYVIYNHIANKSAAIASVGNNSIISNNIIDGTIQFFDGDLFNSGQGIILQMKHYPDFYSDGTQVINNEVRNLGDLAIRAYNTVDPSTYDTPQPITIEIGHNYIHSTDGRPSSVNGAEEDGISFGSAFGHEFYPPVELNEDNHRFYGSPIIIHHNRIEGMQNTGIQVTNNWSGIDIYNNIIAFSGGSGRVDEAGNPVIDPVPAIDTKHGNRILHNTIYDTYGAGINVWGMDYIDNPPLIMNNIIAKTTDTDGPGLSRALAINKDSSILEEIEIANNIYYAIDATSETSGIDGDNSIIGDPLLQTAKPRKGDFHLTIDSPAIDAGAVIDMPLINDDHSSFPRDNQPDIGAYEYIPNFLSMNFDDPNSLAEDQSGYHNNASLIHNAVYDSQGLENSGAIKFLGPDWDQYVKISGNSDFYDNFNFTLSGWINFNSIGIGEQRILDFSGLILRANDDKFNFIVRKRNTTKYSWDITATEINFTNRWYHVAGTFEKTSRNKYTAKLYIDGNLVGTQNKTASPDIPISGDLYIGRANTRALIDGVQYFAKALSDTQIKNLSIQPYLHGHWSFDESDADCAALNLSNDCVVDNSIYQNHGLLAGANRPIRNREGKNGSSIKIDSEWDSLVQIGRPSNLQNHETFTIISWVLPNVGDKNQTILKHGDAEGGGFSFQISSDNRLSFAQSDGLNWQYVKVSTLQSLKLFEQKFFHMVAVTLKNKLVTLYIDGEQVHQETLDNIKAASNANVEIGNSYTSAYIDEVQFYTKALDANEISDQMLELQPN